MNSATAQMLYAKHDMAAQIAAKLAQTEGVPYEVVKETKGFRVKATPQVNLNPLTSALTALKGGVSGHAVDALGGVATVIKTLDEPVKPDPTENMTITQKAVHEVANAPVVMKYTVAELDMMVLAGQAFTFTFKTRGVTPTQLRVFDDEGKPRTFGKAECLSFIAGDETVSMWVSAETAKKWKLVKKAS